MTTARWSPRALAKLAISRYEMNVCKANLILGWMVAGSNLGTSKFFLPWHLLQNLLLFCDFYTKVNLRNEMFTSKFALHLRNVTASI